MAVIAWNTRPEGTIDAFEELCGERSARPRVLLGCDGGVCAKTEIAPEKPRSRNVPEGVTPEQFLALKAGAYWPEIKGLSSATA